MVSFARPTFCQTRGAADPPGIAPQLTYVPCVGSQRPISMVGCRPKSQPGSQLLSHPSPVRRGMACLFACLAVPFASSLLFLPLFSPSLASLGPIRDPAPARSNLVMWGYRHPRSVMWSAMGALQSLMGSLVQLQDNIGEFRVDCDLETDELVAFFDSTLCAIAPYTPYTVSLDSVSDDMPLASRAPTPCVRRPLPRTGGTLSPCAAVLAGHECAAPRRSLEA